MQLQVVQEMHTAVKDMELLLHNQKYQTYSFVEIKAIRINKIKAEVLFKNRRETTNSNPNPVNTLGFDVNLFPFSSLPLSYSLGKSSSSGIQYNQDQMFHRCQTVNTY